MDWLDELLKLFLSWIIVAVIIWFACGLVYWARKRKDSGLLIAALFHTVLPDPQVEQKVKQVVERKTQKQVAQKSETDDSLKY